MQELSMNKIRKYFRKCGECNKRDEQTNMIRTDNSFNGWLCQSCYNELSEYSAIDFEDDEYNGDGGL